MFPWSILGERQSWVAARILSSESLQIPGGRRGCIAVPFAVNEKLPCGCALTGDSFQIHRCRIPLSNEWSHVLYPTDGNRNAAHHMAMPRRLPEVPSRSPNTRGASGHTPMASDALASCESSSGRDVGQLTVRNCFERGTCLKCASPRRVARHCRIES